MDKKTKMSLIAQFPDQDSGSRGNVPAKSFGDWEETECGAITREIVINNECIRVEYITHSKEMADAIAVWLNTRESDLDAARGRLHAVADRLEPMIAGAGKLLSGEIRSLIDAAKEVEALFEKGNRSDAAAREYRSWEKRFQFGKARVKNDPRSAVMAEIEGEWRSRKDSGQKFKAVEFAREMHQIKRFQKVTIEAIKNAQTRWNKKYHPAG